MKSRIGWKEMLVSLSVLIIFIGTFRYAIGDVAFPNIFTAGTPAVASQVNANFQAINTRQTAAFANLAGIYYIKDLQTWKKADPRITDNVGVNCNCACTSSFQGTMTLTADGKVTATGTKTEECACATSCCPNTASISLSGTYTVNADGSGVITINEDPISKLAAVVPVITTTYAYQASKDLNTLMLNAVDTNSLGIALRK